MSTNAPNPLINPARPTERTQRVNRANIRFAKTITPHLVCGMFPNSPTVLSCYSALVALGAENIKDPRLFEIALVSGRSESAITRGSRRLESAGLITKDRVRGIGRPLVYRVIPLRDVPLSTTNAGVML